MGYDVVPVIFSSVYFTLRFPPYFCNFAWNCVHGLCNPMLYRTALFAPMHPTPKRLSIHTQDWLRSYTVIEEDFLHIVKQVYKADTGC